MQLFQILTCSLSAVAMVSQSLFWFVPFYVFAILRLIIPVRGSRKFFARRLIWVAGRWMYSTRLVLRWVARTQFDVRGVEGLSRTESYLVLANHQSWADPMVLAAELGPHIPLVRFFAKRQLIWLPFFGLAFWALDFPYMRRYSREYLAKNPDQRGKDLETTRRLCKKFRSTPVSIVNFAEGTRFTRAKHAAQSSPYRHLLRPRAGGVAFTLAAMEGRIDKILDVTLVYPSGPVSFFGLFSGRMQKIVLDVRERSVPRDLLEADYLGDPAHRERYQAWIRDVWLEKDDRVEGYRTQVFGDPATEIPVAPSEVESQELPAPKSPVSPPLAHRPYGSPKAAASERA